MSPMIDLHGLGLEARADSATALRDAQACGISLFSADEDGHVFEHTADGHAFAVELQGDHLTRIREVA